MRDFNEGDDVTQMYLEHYPGMTERQLAGTSHRRKQARRGDCAGCRLVSPPGSSL